MSNHKASVDDQLQRVPRHGSSEQAWEVNRRNIGILLSRLQSQLVERAQYDSACGEGSKRGWDDVGSEQHVTIKLAEIVAFLGDRRVCDELGIQF